MKYYNSIIMHDTSVAEVREKVEEELKKEGFGILTEIDFKATMKKKLDKDILPHLILGACNPAYADKVVSLDPHISTMLPCNVTLRQLEDGNVEVATIDPAAAMDAVNNEQLKEYANEIQNKLQRVLSNL